ncbi:MAG: hypothetical protein ACLFWR_10260 [Acidimicrobiales bacterium]
MSFTAGHEHRQRAGRSSAWTESWEFRVASPQLDLGAAVAVVRRPAESKMSYWATVCGRARPTIVVLEHDIAHPRRGLELRASGIWADHVCESPHAHWSVGLEAFGLALEGPDELVATGRGLPTPLGFDLEWEMSGGPSAVESPVDDGYVAVGSGHGEVLVGDAVLEIDGPGQRLHRWGTGPCFAEWWAAGDTAGFGAAPWTVAEVAEVSVADPTGAVVELRLGHLLDHEGPGAAAWTSSVRSSPTL